MEVASSQKVITFNKPNVVYLFMLFLMFIGTGYCIQEETNSSISVLNKIFIEKLSENYNQNSNHDHIFNFTQFSQFYNDIVGRDSSLSVTEGNQAKFSECFQYNLTVEISQCLFIKIENSCLNAVDLYDLYFLSTNTSLSIQDFQELSVGILYSVQTGSCSSSTSDHHRHHEEPSLSAVWGYGILFVTIINLCSLVGVIVLPFMKLVIYRLLLIYMVALAVGTLAGSGLLFLIPEAFGLVAEGDQSYIWKSCTIIGGIYLFYLTERILKMLTVWRQNKKHEAKDKDIYCSIRQRTPKKSESEYKDPSTIPNSASTCTQSTLLNDEISDSSESNKTATTVKTNGIAHHHEEKEIATVAWMIIFGDGLHNFIDGLSIGAAFTNSILSGVSVSLACICEELPHELGDFAILLNSGMSLRKALMYNFLSACMCYLGLIVGIVLGENTSAHEWIFAVAGGMFLYISLVDMMPEMSAAAESDEAKKYGSIKIFLLQNVGLLTGFSIMLVMAIYGGEINF